MSFKGGTKMLQPLRQNTLLQALKILLFILATIFVLIVWGVLTQAYAQAPAKSFADRQATAQATAKPIYSEYKGVKIGSTADEVRQKLGEPKELGDNQFFYVFSEKETAQIVFDAQKKVTAISIDYVGTGSGTPECKAVVGADLTPRPDGSLYKLIRYPKLGYWVSYNRTTGDSPIVSITIQKQQ
jgi:outer membrane protein assembly factor BamE (lipoprotein component of BamABCDE complex)